MAFIKEGGERERALRGSMDLLSKIKCRRNEILRKNKVPVWTRPPLQEASNPHMNGMFVQHLEQ